MLCLHFFRLCPFKNFSGYNFYQQQLDQTLGRLGNRENKSSVCNQLPHMLKID